MTLRIGWLSPFNNRTGVGTFSKAVTDAFPRQHGGEAIDLTIVAPIVRGLYPTRHRLIDIDSTRPESDFYDLFDVLVVNIGNNTEHHGTLFRVLRNRPCVVVCHDYVYQHFLAALIHEQGEPFLDYVALAARYGSAANLRAVRQANLTRMNGLRFAPWDSDVSANEPLAAPLLHLGSALVVHSAFAETYARRHFSGPVLCLGMPHDQRPSAKPARAAPLRRDGGRRMVVSFGHVQPTKCIDDVLMAIAGCDRLRSEILYVVSGFVGDDGYLQLLRGLVADHGLDEAVRFQLDLTDGELAHLVESADAFVNLRYPNTEGASVSLIEQLVTGKPVVVLDAGCYAEIPADAAIKVARPRDTAAIGEAIVRLLDPPDTLAEIGRRGRAHAMRFDCAGYASGLLAFCDRERSTIDQRARVKARWRIDGEPAVIAAQPEGDRWDEQLATARGTFDAIDVGRLHLQPSLLRALAPDQLADYVQAIVVRDGLSHGVHETIRTYMRGQDDAFVAVRTLQIVRQAVVGHDPNALDCLPDIVPHGDIRFWATVATLGAEALAVACHVALFGTRLSPEEHYGSGVARLALAEDLARRDTADLKTSLPNLDRIVRWLREEGAHGEIGSLEAIPRGSTIAVGSSEQRRYLRLFGFFDPYEDHAWTSEGKSLIYLQAPRDATSIILSGHTLADSPVTIAAETPNRTQIAECSPGAGKLTRFRIDLATDSTIRLPSEVRVAIKTTRCQSPAALGISSDQRVLGFCLKHVGVA